MAYITADEARYLQPQLTDTELSDTAIDNIIATFVDPHIDSRLARSYALPLSSTPVVVKTVAGMLALAYSLDAVWGQAGPGTESSQGKRLKGDADKMLDEIVDRKRELVASDGSIFARLRSAVLTTGLSEELHSETIFVDDEEGWEHRDETRAS